MPFTSEDLVYIKYDKKYQQYFHTLNDEYKMKYLDAVIRVYGKELLEDQFLSEAQRLLPDQFDTLDQCGTYETQKSGGVFGISGWVIIFGGAFMANHIGPLLNANTEADVIIGTTENFYENIA